MAFKISQIESVEFGDKQCTPELDAERKLRLGRLDFSTETKEKEADKVIASCFPEDEAFVREYLTRCSTLSKQRLQAYLIGGEEAVKIIENGLKSQIEGAMKGKEQ